nr:hypothetical protein Iba_chr08eCG7340 [Ipomoea batatas]
MFPTPRGVPLASPMILLLNIVLIQYWQETRWRGGNPIMKRTPRSRRGSTKDMQNTVGAVNMNEKKRIRNAAQEIYHCTQSPAWTKYSPGTEATPAGSPKSDLTRLSQGEEFEHLALWLETPAKQIWPSYQWAQNGEATAKARTGPWSPHAWSFQETFYIRHFKVLVFSLWKLGKQCLSEALSIVPRVTEEFLTTALLDVIVQSQFGVEDNLLESLKATDLGRVGPSMRSNLLKDKA